MSAIDRLLSTRKAWWLGRCKIICCDANKMESPFKQAINRSLLWSGSLRSRRIIHSTSRWAAPSKSTKTMIMTKRTKKWRSIDAMLFNKRSPASANHFWLKKCCWTALQQKQIKQCKRTTLYPPSIYKTSKIRRVDWLKGPSPWTKIYDASAI